jgi:TRAP-type mannitol/chloroaromatic compound transport system permease large subunit
MAMGFTWVGGSMFVARLFMGIGGNTSSFSVWANTIIVWCWKFGVEHARLFGIRASLFIPLAGKIGKLFLFSVFVAWAFGGIGYHSAAICLF